MKTLIYIWTLIVITNSIFSMNAISYECINPNNKLGQCVSLYYCPNLLKLSLNSPRIPDNGTYLQESYCDNGFGPPPFVCCSNDISFTRDNTKTFASNDGHLLATPAQCTRHAYLSLVFFSVHGWPCFGSLINDRYILTSILTAASLKTHYYKIYSIGKNATGFRIDKVIWFEEHKTSNKPDKSYVSLIRLAERVQFTDQMAPICLPSSVNGFESYKIGDKITIPYHPEDKIEANLIQWGKIVLNGGFDLMHPKQATVRVLPPYSDRVNYGTPVVAQHTGAWIIDGLYSNTLTNQCITYFQIADYEDWILSKIEP